MIEPFYDVAGGGGVYARTFLSKKSRGFGLGWEFDWTAVVRHGIFCAFGAQLRSAGTRLVVCRLETRDDGAEPKRLEMAATKLADDVTMRVHVHSVRHGRLRTRTEGVLPGTAKGQVAYTRKDGRHRAGKTATDGKNVRQSSVSGLAGGGYR